MSTFMPLPSRALLVSTLLAGLALAGCSSLTVQTVATPTGAPPVFELQGSDPERLQAEAQRRCPHGHEVLARSDRAARMEHDNHRPARWWTAVSQFFDDRDNRSQQTISCKAAAQP